MEPPVAPWSDPATREFPVIFRGCPKSSLLGRLPISANVWQRSDGFFVFSLTYPDISEQSAAAHDGFDSYAIDIASYASVFIKKRIIEINAGVADVDSDIAFEGAKNNPFRSIMVKPIKISKQLAVINPVTLLDDLKNDTYLRDLPAKIRENQNSFFKGEETVPAILLLRRHFGRCYDKALKVRHNFKTRKLRIPYWWSRDDKKWAVQRAFAFDFYGVRHITVGWLLYSLFLAWNVIRTLPTPYFELDANSVAKFYGDGWNRLLTALNILPSETKNVVEWFGSVLTDMLTLAISANVAFAVTEAIFWVLGLGVFPAVVIAWFLVIYEKRRKTVMANDRAITVLQSGNYYHAILKRIMTFGTARAKASAGEIPTDFSLLITRLEGLKRIELEKETSNKRILYIVGFISALAFGTIINVPEVLFMILNSEHVREWLDVFTLAPTRRN